MIEPDFLALLRCPATRQTLAVAPPDLLERSRDRLPDDTSEALVRADGKMIYPLKDGIPVLLVEAGISV